MRYLLALIPILLVLVLMLRHRWGAHQAGPLGWLAGLLVASAGFGLTPEVLWVSQAKGLLLSLFVLAVMWPALFLFHWNDQNGGIAAVARWLEAGLPNRGMCLVLMAWCLSGLLEGLAGFGLPIAVVAPMLAALEVKPLQAVAAVAMGHCWAVTFGSMGLVVQTLATVVGLDAARLIPWAALLLGFVCLFCGLSATVILGQGRQWPKVAALSVVVAGTQYALASCGLMPVSAFGAGLAGLGVYWLCAHLRARLSGTRWQLQCVQPALPIRRVGRVFRNPASLTFASYGALTVLMAVLTMITPLRVWTQGVAWKASFPEVETRLHFTTPAGSGQVFRPLSHPGTLMVVVACLSMGLAGLDGGNIVALAGRAGRATWRSAAATTVGVITMVGLSTLMDHCQMSYLLAQGLSRLLAAAYPLVSPSVGILGAFATGSNNNSNVLFGPLQKNVAILLHINPYLLVAAQTAGGSLGSMLAPVKVLLGCSTVGMVGNEGQVMRKTVPCGILFGLLLGIVTLLLARYS
jgi:lactate permease